MHCLCGVFFFVGDKLREENVITTAKHNETVTAKPATRIQSFNYNVQN